MKCAVCSFFLIILQCKKACDIIKTYNILHGEKWMKKRKEGRN